MFLLTEFKLFAPIERYAQFVKLIRYMLLIVNIYIPLYMATDFISLTPRQKRILAAVEELAAKREMNEEVTFRDLTNKHTISVSSLFSVARIGHIPHAVLEARDGTVRNHRFTPDHDRIIVYSILKFHNNGTPLGRGCVLDLK